MFFAYRIISALLSFAFAAGSVGIPLAEAYCCDKLESVSVFSYDCNECHECESSDAAPKHDCCSTAVIIKKVETSGLPSLKKQLLSTIEFTTLCASFCSDCAIYIPQLKLPSFFVARGKPPSGGDLLALVCILRL